MLGHRVQRVRQAAGLGGRAVELGEPVRHRRAAPQLRCAGGSPRRGASRGATRSRASPSPAGRTPRRGRAGRPRERYAASAARDDLERVEQAEVQRRRQQRVRHPRVAREHRVLVGAEGRQPVVDEVVERGQRLRPGGGEPPRPVPARRTRLPVALPPVEVGADLASISSSSGQTAPATPSVRRPFGGGSRFSASKFHRPPAGSPSRPSARRAGAGRRGRSPPSAAAAHRGPRPSARSRSRLVTKPRAGSRSRSRCSASRRTRPTAAYDVGCTTSAARRPAPPPRRTCRPAGR